MDPVDGSSQDSVAPRPEELNLKLMQAWDEAELRSAGNFLRLAN